MATAVVLAAMIGTSCGSDAEDTRLDDAVAALEAANEALRAADEARVGAEAAAPAREAADAAQAEADAAAAAAVAAQAEADAAAAAEADAAAADDAEAAAAAAAEAAVAAAEAAEAEAAAAAAIATAEAEAAAAAEAEAAAAEAAAADAAAAAEAAAAAAAEDDEDGSGSSGLPSWALGPIATVAPSALGAGVPTLTLVPLECDGDDLPDGDMSPNVGDVELDIDGDGDLDMAHTHYGNDTGRWYLEVVSTRHGATFYLDIGPNHGEADFQPAFATDVNEDDWDELWVQSTPITGTHVPVDHTLYVLIGCSLRVVGSNIGGAEDVIHIYEGTAPGDGQTFWAYCSTYEGEPLFTYHEDKPLDGGSWAYRPLPLRLNGATFEMVYDVALEGAIAPEPDPWPSGIDCPSWS